MTATYNTLEKEYLDLIGAAKSQMESWRKAPDGILCSFARLISLDQKKAVLDQVRKVLTDAEAKVGCSTTWLSLCSKN